MQFKNTLEAQLFVKMLSHEARCCPDDRDSPSWQSKWIGPLLANGIAGSVKETVVY